MKTLDDAPFLDLFSPSFQEDPGSAIREAMAESWLARTVIGGMALGRAQVQALLSDRRLRSSLTELVALQGITSGPLFDSISRSILAVDGEPHLRLRRLVNRAFTPKAVDRHRPQMRAVLGDLLAPVTTRGRCDFMADIAEHYPIEVMCHLLGVPGEDHEQFAAWNRSITWMLSFDLGSHRDEVLTAMDALRDYVAALAAERRAHPRDDMVTEMVMAEESGDRLTMDEVQMMIAGLLFAGYDTTRNQLGLAMWLFADRPEQWALLATDPALAAAAVEEAMRFKGAVAAAPRVVAEDLDIDGYHLPAGTMLALSTAAANQDPAAFDDPTTFDITATREPQLTFGGGPHYCLGASLARAEMQEALPMLARAMRGLALDGEPTWRPPMGIFGPETLPIKFRAG